MTRKSAYIILLAALAVLIPACAPAEPTPTPTAAVPPAPVALRPTQVQERFQAGDAIVLDVREPEEWINDGHIDGAILIPLSQLPDRVGELNADADIIVLCRNGNRSKAALQVLGEKGFTHLYELYGGMRAWIAEGLPVVYGE